MYARARHTFRCSQATNHLGWQDVLLKQWLKVFSLPENVESLPYFQELEPELDLGLRNRNCYEG